MSIRKIIDVYTGPPGCGKTTDLLDEMISVPGRYLFSMPRHDLIEERLRDLQSRASAAGVRPIIVAIHSKQGHRVPVHRRVKDAAHAYTNEPHVIVLITHEALTTADLGGYAGWQARVDEVPDAVASGSLRIPVSWTLFQDTYRLDPVPGTSWWKAVVREGAPSRRDVLTDDIADDLAVFHKRALSTQGVYIDLADWGEAATRRKVKWWSAWTPIELSHFASVKIAASGYFTSLLHRATEAWYRDEVHYVEHAKAAQRTAWPRVRISYFTREHQGSTSFWDTEQGRGCLEKVGRYLANVETLGFWSGNKLVQERFAMLLNGARVSPKQAGSNEYRRLTSCAMIYSSKTQRSDNGLLEAFGLSKKDIERARQAEDIEQFIMRGAIRCPDFGGYYEIYLYDSHQAEAVHRFLHGHGFADVELIGLDEVGIIEEQRPRPGPKPVSTDAVVLKLRADERLEKDRLRKQRDRAEARQRKAEAGTLRSPGRPPKLAA